MRCVVAPLSIVEQIPKAARGRTRTPKVRQLPDKKLPLNASTFQPIAWGLPNPRLRLRQNEIDTLSRILVKGQSTEGN
jgi:hypothetical protein